MFLKISPSSFLSLITSSQKKSWRKTTRSVYPTALHVLRDDSLAQTIYYFISQFEDFINPDTQAETEVIGDAGLKTLKENDIIQLERRGFYRVDRAYVNNGKPLMLFMIPDGKKKAMSGLDGKLAHR
jgi:glutamyl-tRNA synthetase